MIVNDHQKKNDYTMVIDDMMLLKFHKKRRAVCNQTCLLSVTAAFTMGLAIGIFLLPLIGLTSAKSPTDVISSINNSLNSQPVNVIVLTKYAKTHKYDLKPASVIRKHKSQIHELRGRSKGLIHATEDNDSINQTDYSSVSFISDKKFTMQNILNDWKNANASRLYTYNNTKVDDIVEESSIRAARQQVPTTENIFSDFNDLADDKNVPETIVREKVQQNILSVDMGPFSEKHASAQNSYEKDNSEILEGILDENIYWGQMVESRLPIGFEKLDIDHWRTYLDSDATKIVKIEQGCGRMQNRLVTFNDGVKACVRYRQNTDQIQGELFSFYLGRLLNITNLAPSTAALVDWNSQLWSEVREHITESQWKTSRPVVLTKWIANLKPSGIPKVFQPIERHLNKDDIRNITLEDGAMKPTQILINRLKPKHNAHGSQNAKKIWQTRKIVLSEQMFEKLIELAQWSDLIVFDYLIANLDRVVNNLYNFQWNADIMAAPAHNLARQVNSQLLLFLDNESGLLHGYRLLKKYEAYHELLLDTLCVFRKPTINALKIIRDNNPGELLNNFFERTTSNTIRESLPPLPEKSIRILTDRIDRVLRQVQKCKEIYSKR